MSDALFPVLSGLAWSVTKTPSFVTKVQASVSRRELRASFTPYPQWQWQLTYELLRADSGATDFATLAGFFLARQGQFDSFLYADPNDGSVTDMAFGTGDGAIRVFQLTRTLGGFVEPIYNTTGTIVVKVAGVVTSVSITKGVVTFSSAPANGAALTWTGSYLWRVRFVQDAASFEEFAHQLYALKQLTLLAVVGG